MASSPGTLRPRRRHQRSNASGPASQASAQSQVERTAGTPREEESIYVESISTTKRPQLELDGNDAPEKTSDNASRRKRARVTRACDQCRKRKDRCDSLQPACSSCVAMSLACSYSPSRKRGLRAGQLRSLEIILGLVFQSIEGSESWISALLEGVPLSWPVFAFRVPPAVSEQDAVASLLDACRKSSVLKEAEQLMSTGMNDATDDEVQDESNDTLEQKLASTLQAVLGLFSPARDGDGPDLNSIEPVPTTSSRMEIDSNTATSLTQPVAISRPEASIGLEDNSCRRSPIASATDTVVMTSCSQLDTTPQPPVTAVLRGADHTQLPSHWPQLLELYFSKTHCWFPICQKHNLLRAAYLMANTATSSSSLTTSPDVASRGDCASLWAVLAYSSQLWDSMKPPKPGKQQDMSHGEILAIASNLVSPGEPEHEYDGGLAQAWLLFSLLQIEQGRWNAAWTAVGRAISIASFHGDFLNVSSKPELHRVGDGKKRIFLGCFVLETLISTRLRKRPHLQYSDIQSLGLLSQDGMEEWEPWIPSAGTRVGDRQPGPFTTQNQPPGRIPSVFNQLVELMGLANDALRLDSGGQKASRIQELEHSLQVWKERFHPHHKEPLGLSLSPQLLNLQFAFLSVSEALKIEAAALYPENPSQADAERWTHVRNACSHLEDRIRSLGIDSLPSIIPVHIELFDHLIDHQEKWHQDLTFKEQARSLKGTLHAIQERLRPRQHNFLSPELGNGTSNNISGMTEVGWTENSAGHQPAQDSVYVAPRDSLSTDVQPGSQRRPIDPARSGNLPGVSKSMQQSLIDTFPGDSQTSNMTSEMRVVPLSENVPGSGDQEEDALFDSLTMLDPTNW